jgi:hypothetical protein
MNEKSLRSLIEHGSVKQLHIVADGAFFHVDVVTTKKGQVTALTSKGTVKTWATLDSTAKWIRSLGIGKAQLDISGWRPGQRELPI